MVKTARGIEKRIDVSRWEVLSRIVGCLWGLCGAVLIARLDGCWACAAPWLSLGTLIGFELPVVVSRAGLQFVWWFAVHFDRVVALGTPTKTATNSATTATDSTVLAQEPEHEREVSHAAGIVVPLLLGLLPGTLLGPFAGIALAAGVGWSAFGGAWLGWMLGVAAATYASTMLVEILGGSRPAGEQPPPVWLTLVSPVLLVPASWHCVRMFANLPRQRRCIERWSQREITWSGDFQYGFDSIDIRDDAIGDAEVEELVCFRQVLQLTLRSWRITDAALPVLRLFPELVVLDLTGSGITDAGLPVLARLKRLVRLDLTGTRVSPADVQRLCAALPRCKIDFGIETGPWDWQDRELR